jgi:thioester reductase-like protein
MTVREFYRDKVILLTGTTGFIGKVLLEMILRKLPEFRKLYVLIRAKTGLSLMERFNNEVS